MTVKKSEVDATILIPTLEVDAVRQAGALIYIYRSFNSFLNHGLDSAQIYPSFGNGVNVYIYASNDVNTHDNVFQTESRSGARER